MTKQQAILEGIERDIRFGVCVYQYQGFGSKEMYHQIALRVREGLHSQNVVVKVKGKLLDKYAIADFGGGLGLDNTPLFDKDGIKEAGLVTVEPLIERR